VIIPSAAAVQHECCDLGTAEDPQRPHRADATADVEQHRPDAVKSGRMVASCRDDDHRSEEWKADL
jgi:hypothetical protein